MESDLACRILRKPNLYAVVEHRAELLLNCFDRMTKSLPSGSFRHKRSVKALSRQVIRTVLGNVPETSFPTNREPLTTSSRASKSAQWIRCSFGERTFHSGHHLA